MNFRFKQQGSALSIAVFIIVAMSLLVAAISKSISSSTDQSIQEVLGTRALLAAESGNELVLAMLFPLDTPSLTSCPVITPPDFSAIDGLKNCVVSTQCSYIDPDAQGTSYYLVESTGVCKALLAGNISDFTCSNADDVCVSRSIEVEAKAL